MHVCKVVLKWQCISRLRTRLSMKYVKSISDSRLSLTASLGPIDSLYLTKITNSLTSAEKEIRSAGRNYFQLYTLARGKGAEFNLGKTGLIHEVFQNVPPIEIDPETEGRTRDRNRKLIEGDCSICFTAFEGAEGTVYCRATRGQNIITQGMFPYVGHHQAQDYYPSFRRPLVCRNPWQDDEDMAQKIQSMGIAGVHGY